MPPRIALAPLLLAASALPAMAQTADGSPTDPAPPGLVGPPRPFSRTAPSTGAHRDAPAGAAGTKPRPLPKPTAAELAEKRKLDHDLKICIGC